MCLLHPDEVCYFLQCHSFDTFVNISCAAVTSLWALMWMLLIPSGAKLVPPFTTCSLKGACRSALGKLEPLKTKQIKKMDAQLIQTHFCIITSDVCVDLTWALLFH